MGEEKMTYAEKLKDPRRQKKRLEIFQGDDRECQRCGNKEETLHVHRCYYEKGIDPWEYESASLITVCHRCHHFLGNHIVNYREGERQ